MTLLVILSLGDKWDYWGKREDLCEVNLRLCFTKVGIFSFGIFLPIYFVSSVVIFFLSLPLYFCDQLWENTWVLTKKVLTQMLFLASMDWVALRSVVLLFALCCVTSLWKFGYHFVMKSLKHLKNLQYNCFWEFGIVLCREGTIYSLKWVREEKKLSNVLELSLFFWHE